MFTEQARGAILHAQDEARELGHGTVRVEHLLLGLFSDQDGIAGRVFTDFGLMGGSVRDLVRQRLGVGIDPIPDGKVPFSPEAKAVLRSANRFAMGEPGTEHMLIAIIGRGEGDACDILRTLGADPHRIRFETKKRERSANVPEPGTGTTPLARVRSVPSKRIREIDFGD